MITGITTSRLIELEKRVISDDILIKYKLNGDINNNGLVINECDDNKITYYVDSIKYVDTKLNENNITYTLFEPTGLNDNNSINMNYIKDEYKLGLISDYKISSDVNIDRSKISVFEKIYAISETNNLTEIVNYAGGIYFNIQNI